MTSPHGTARDAKAQAHAEKAYRKAQRPFYKKKRFIIPAVLAVIVIISVATRGGSSDEPAAIVNGVPQEQPAEFVAAFPGATEDDVVAQAGQAVTANGVTMTSTAIEPVTPEFGSPQLCTDVTYVNGSGQPTSFNGGFDWKLQDPNGAILMNGFSSSEDRLASGELAPGGTVSGQVCFDAPRGDTAGQYVVLLDPSFQFSSERMAWLNTIG